MVRGRILTVIMVIVIAVALFMATMETNLDDVFGDSQSGTVLTIFIEKVSDGTQYTAEADLDDISLTQSLLGGYAVPFTTYTSDVPPLEPLGIYTITFSVTTSITNVGDISLITSEEVWITNTFGYIDNAYLYNAGGSKIVKGSGSDLDPSVPNTFTTAPFTQYRYAESDIMDIKGKHINNSTFDLRITVNALDSAGYPTSTTIDADILLNVLSPTDLNVVIDNVGVST